MKKGMLTSWINGFLGAMVIAVAAIWMILFIDRIVMPIIVRSDIELVVPDLRSLSIAEAMQIGNELGIEIESERARVDNNHPRGTVLDQYPLSGSIVKPGRRIDVILSTRERLILCPEIVGMSPREARLIADSSGLNIAESQLEFTHSKLVPEGVVISQSPSSMTGMMRGDSIKFTVSLGIMPVNIIAPNLVGRNYDDLRFVLAQNRLKIGNITRYPDKSAREGQILTQHPTPGTQMEHGEKMDFSIAIKPSDRSR